MSNEERQKEQKPAVEADQTELSNEQLEETSAGRGTTSSHLLLPYFEVDLTSSGQDDGDDTKDRVKNRVSKA